MNMSRNCTEEIETANMMSWSILLIMNETQQHFSPTEEKI